MDDLVNMESGTIENHIDKHYSEDNEIKNRNNSNNSNNRNNSNSYKRSSGRNNECGNRSNNKCGNKSNNKCDNRRNNECANRSNIKLNHRMTRIILGALIVIWLAVIFIFSAQNGKQSAGLSNGITKFLVSSFYPPFNKMSVEGQTEILGNVGFFVRKLAHFTEYGILATLSTLFAMTFEKRKYFVNKYFLVVFFCAFAASTDEFHQMFVDGRGPQVRDVCIDTCGAITGMLVTLGVCRIFGRYVARRRC